MIRRLSAPALSAALLLGTGARAPARPVAVAPSHQLDPGGAGGGEEDGPGCLGQVERILARTLAPFHRRLLGLRELARTARDLRGVVAVPPPALPRALELTAPPVVLSVAPPRLVELLNRRLEREFVRGFFEWEFPEIPVPEVYRRRDADGRWYASIHQDWKERRRPEPGPTMARYLQARRLRRGEPWVETTRSFDLLASEARRLETEILVRSTHPFEDARGLPELGQALGRVLQAAATELGRLQEDLMDRAAVEVGLRVPDVEVGRDGHLRWACVEAVAAEPHPTRARDPRQETDRMVDTRILPPLGATIQALMERALAEVYFAGAQARKHIGTRGAHDLPPAMGLLPDGWSEARLGDLRQPWKLGWAAGRPETGAPSDGARQRRIPQFWHGGAQHLRHLEQVAAPRRQGLSFQPVRNTPWMAATQAVMKARIAAMLTTTSTSEIP